MVEKSGDWERRNRLKVYTAAFLLIGREFSEAATLLLDSVSTFTCYELFSYRRFVLYTVICTTMTQVV
jgi:26S proteasome regulatory subunit N7